MEQFLDVLGLPFLACLAMVSILGYVGFHVLAREIIFIDIALAQIAAVGAIIAHFLSIEHDSVVVSYACSLGATIVAAAFYAVVRNRVHQIPLEAIIGISYGVTAAAALFLVGIAPGGHLHIQHMLAGSILWTSWTDLLRCSIVFSIAGLGFHAIRKPIHMISADYDRAVRSGKRVIFWDFLFYVLVGIVVTQAVRVGGVVVVFAFLIIPATVSLLFFSGGWKCMAAALGAGTTASLLGLVFADRLDFSVGPSVVLFLGVCLALGSLVKRGWSVVAGGFAAVVLLGFIGLAVFRPSTSTSGPPPGAGGIFRVPCVLKDRVEHPGEGTAGSARTREEETLNRDAGALQPLLEETEDPDAMSRIVCRTLGLDPNRGVLMALDFLERDPPFFYRQTVVEKLVQIEQEAAALDLLAPFSAEVNRKAAARIRRKYDAGSRK